MSRALQKRHGLERTVTGLQRTNWAPLGQENFWMNFEARHGRRAAL